MLKPFIAAACLCAATVAEAEPDRLSGQDIIALVAGATVEIDTTLDTKLPIRYTVDGKMSGQARDLASYLGAAPTQAGGGSPRTNFVISGTAGSIPSLSVCGSRKKARPSIGTATTATAARP